jgi:hypothetical protein
MRVRKYLNFRGVNRFLDGSATVVVNVADRSEMARLPGAVDATFLRDGRGLASWRSEDRKLELWVLPPRMRLHHGWMWAVLAMAIGATAAWWYGRRLRLRSLHGPARRGGVSGRCKQSISASTVNTGLASWQDQ